MDGGQGRMLVVLHLGNGDEAKATKDTSTKRAMILAYVDNIPETHFNLSKILNSLKVHMMKYHHTIVGVEGFLNCSCFSPVKIYVNQLFMSKF